MLLSDTANGHYLLAWSLLNSSLLCFIFFNKILANTVLLITREKRTFTERTLRWQWHSWRLALAASEGISDSVLRACLSLDIASSYLECKEDRKLYWKRKIIERKCMGIAKWRKPQMKKNPHIRRKQVGKKFSSTILTIRENLLHPKRSSFRFGLSLWLKSSHILGNNCSRISFYL